MHSLSIICTISVSLCVMLPSCSGKSGNVQSGPRFPLYMQIQDEKWAEVGHFLSPGSMLWRDRGKSKLVQSVPGFPLYMGLGVEIWPKSDHYFPYICLQWRKVASFRASFLSNYFPYICLLWRKSGQKTIIPVPIYANLIGKVDRNGPLFHLYMPAVREKWTEMDPFVSLYMACNDGKVTHFFPIYGMQWRKSDPLSGHTFLPYMAFGDEKRIDFHL